MFLSGLSKSLQLFPVLTHVNILLPCLLVKHDMLPKIYTVFKLIDLLHQKSIDLNYMIKG
jgi:hypothetical protein